MPQSLIEKAIKASPSINNEKNKMFLSLLTQNMMEEDTDHFEPSLLAQIAKTHLELSKIRTTGNSQIKIYSSSAYSDGHRRTVIDIVSPDRAFLIDSVVAEINRHSYLIDILLHPILNVSHKANGTFDKFHEDSDENTKRQSHIHVQIKDNLTDEATKELEDGLYAVLSDVFTANKDWPEMLKKLDQACKDLAAAKTRRPLNEVQQYCAFLEYLQDNFTLLGYREYEFFEDKGGPASRLVG